MVSIHVTTFFEPATPHLW